MNSLIIAIVLFLILDIVYVSSLKQNYISLIKKIQYGKNPKINITSAILSYIVLIIGFVFIVVPSVMTHREKLKTFSYIDMIKLAFISGGLVGFVIYGVFNTTNVALFKDYSLKLALLDTLWGTTIFFVSTLVYIMLSISK